MITVVTCDIVGSSKYPSAVRAQMQEYLLNSWESVQRKYSGNLDSALGLRVTAGDEFQFVGKDIESAVDCLTLLRILCRTLPLKPPFTFRGSIGIGERDVAGTDNPYTQDGPAFHLARAGMDDLKKSNVLTTIRTSKSGNYVKTANVLLMLMDAFYANWTSAQSRVMKWAWEGLSGEEIARESKISPAAVSKHLSAAHFENYVIALKELKKILCNSD